jgi:hypothetical protein
VVVAVGFCRVLAVLAVQAVLEVVLVAALVVAVLVLTVSLGLLATLVGLQIMRARQLLIPIPEVFGLLLAAADGAHRGALIFTLEAHHLNPEALVEKRLH